MKGRIALAAMSGLALVGVSGAQSRASPAEDEFAQAAQLTSNGAFEDSVAHWKKAETAV